MNTGVGCLLWMHCFSSSTSWLLWSWNMLCCCLKCVCCTFKTSLQHPFSFLFVFWSLRNMPAAWDPNWGKLLWLWRKLCPEELVTLWAGGFSHVKKVDSSLGLYGKKETTWRVQNKLVPLSNSSPIANKQNTPRGIWKPEAEDPECLSTI